MLSAGSVFAGYRIERVLGAGGMGAVYLVRDPDLPRHDALKVLSPELSRDRDFRARFVREADVAAALDHPHIVAVYRRGEFDGQLWIAMQFVDGTDADDALREGAMTPARAVHIIGRVSEAVDFAHRHGVVHRDIKPANFLLSGPVGPDERVMLGDFGIARALGDVGLTVTGSVMATMSYAAPEVLAGASFDHRADLYSLGCTLFRLLTGQTPFSGANGPAAVVAAHLQAPPPKVTERAPGFSARMDAVIATAMAKDPAHRFSSAGQLAAAAAAALDDAAAGTTAPWLPIPSAQVSAYSPPTVMAPTAHFPPPGLPAPSPRRRRRWPIAAIVAALVVAAAAAGTAVLLTTRSHPPASSPASAAGGPVPASTLPGLLLPPDQIAAIMAVPDISTPQSGDSLIEDSSGLADKQCLSAFQPALTSTYHSAGPAAVRYQILTNFTSGSVSVTQAVIALSTADAAHRLVTDQAAQWSGCAGQTIPQAGLGGSQVAHWTFGKLTNTGGTLSMTHFAEEHRFAVCQRALGARSNVVIDVLACRIQADNQAADILNAIAAKVPH